MKLFNPHALAEEVRRNVTRFELFGNLEYLKKAQVDINNIFFDLAPERYREGSKYLNLGIRKDQRRSLISKE